MWDLQSIYNIVIINCYRKKNIYTIMRKTYEYFQDNTVVNIAFLKAENEKKDKRDLNILMSSKNCENNSNC